MRQNIFYTITLIFLLFVSPNVIVAETKREAQAYKSPFATPAGLEERVDFWKQIFTKYGKDHRVFHHRQFPEIVYSVLDFTDYENTLIGNELERRKELEIKKEISRIQNSLEHLAEARTPRNSFERKLVNLFARFVGPGREKFKEATDIKQIRYQTGIKERFRDGLVRSGRYLKIMESIFEENGLPKELSRLPLVESSFDYKAYSSVGAAGIWQFMRSTGKQYMKITPHIDERKDPIISTRAAVKYFKNAYDDTESWPLAVTSYNHGLTGILRAARAVGSNDIRKIIRHYKTDSFGFASSNFYCEFLAALEVDRNIEAYFPGLVRETTWEFDEVRLGSSVGFSMLVKISGSTYEDIQRLNPALGKTILENRVGIPTGLIIKVPRYRGSSVVAKISGSKLIS